MHAKIQLRACKAKHRSGMLQAGASRRCAHGMSQHSEKLCRVPSRNGMFAETFFYFCCQ